MTQVTVKPLDSKRPIWALVFFIILSTTIIFACFCYYTALDSPFVLDDMPNFYGLQFIHNFTSALNYSYSGPAGIRWISFLSFTLPVELEAWKNADAFPFKLINLIIHGINSLLVFLLLQKLLRLKNGSHHHLTWWAAGIAVVWAIHPIHVNTVLYSVQRMTLLASTAILLGMHYHLAFITRQQQRATTANWLLYSATIWLITAIGILCKESAVLLPLYILVSYALIPQRAFSRLQNTASLALPYLILLILLIATHRLGYGGRNFTMSERLLSEVFILKDYLFKITLPSFHSFSLFYDDFVLIKSITDTRFLVAALFWLVFIGISALCRTLIPGLWFGCLWFLAGHALESTIIPLELYFDHRNYLPSLGIVIMMAVTLRHFLLITTKKTIRTLLGILLISLCGKYLFLLQEETSYWHNDDSLSSSLVNKHPNSIRATQYYIENLVRQGRYDESIMLIEYMHQKFGISASNAIFQVGLSCLSKPDAAINHTALMDDLRTLPLDMTISNAMEFLLQMTQNKACPSLDWQMYERYTESLLANQKQRRHHHNLVFLLVSGHIQRQDFNSALESSFILPKKLRTPQFVLLQMRLSLQTKNITAAESIYSDILAFDKVQKILYKDAITGSSMALKRLRNEIKN